MKRRNPGEGGPMGAKTVLVTGATSGIGKQTALELARMGATVVLVARDRARGRAALEEIGAKTGNENLELLVADLSAQADVRRLAAEFKRRHDRLHVLVNNAGGIFTARRTTADGLEYTFAFNHLAYFLLTNLLLDVLKASAPARVVNVSSGAQGMAKLDFDDLQGEKRYNPQAAYNRSKLANVLFTYALARRLEGTGVSANVLHPGVVRTNFGRVDTPWLWRVMFPLIDPFMRSPEKGAETPVYLASSPEVEGVSGKYFADRKAVRSNPLSYDEAVQERLWRVSEELTGLRPLSRA
ncbi:SDR family oxidoreductase [Calidithermus chliarophilus]|uniref:SDR family oxidoreductase n=1 Tax=Calidithermus chliarophilus TaxID=52023 RepID=UPI00041A12FE|nr:SDR family oxidoreductase [Calidithermus chliarophilus]